MLSQALAGPLKDMLAYTEDQVVSCEFNSDTYSSTSGAWASITLSDHIVKLIYWYDNKFGYITIHTQTHTHRRQDDHLENSEIASILIKNAPREVERVMGERQLK